MDKHKKNIISQNTSRAYKKTDEEKIQALSELNQKILDNVPLSIVMLDKNGIVTAANKVAKNLMDEPHRPLIGSKLTSTYEIKSNKKLLNLYNLLLNEGKSFHYDNLEYFLSKTNERRSLNIIAVPLLNKKGGAEGAISMALDNTEAILAKKRLRDLNRNLERKVNERTYELNVINKKLNDILDLKSKFVSDASHELRTPLTVIQGNLDLAVREAEHNHNALSEIYPMITNEIKRMKLILSDLTMLTNIDVGNEQIIYEKISLNHLISTVVQSLSVLARQKNIKLINKRAQKAISIIGDDAKLEKTLLNIVGNGIKYTDPGGYVKIWTEQYENGVRITVLDNGIGIPESDLPYIFERFYRVNKARSRKEGGSGLGLSIAKWIIKAHNGSIEAQSVEGKGTKFTIFLPYNYRSGYQKNGLF